MCALGTTGTTRASFALYNTEEVPTFLKSMNGLWTCSPDLSAPFSPCSS
ncbi:MAG: hypothetical protein ACLT8E_11290 [Akkermansia sp.]